MEDYVCLYGCTVASLCSNWSITYDVNVKNTRKAMTMSHQYIKRIILSYRPDLPQATVPGVAKCQASTPVLLSHLSAFPRGSLYIEPTLAYVIEPVLSALR